MEIAPQNKLPSPNSALQNLYPKLTTLGKCSEEDGGSFSLQFWGYDFTQGGTGCWNFSSLPSACCQNSIPSRNGQEDQVSFPRFSSHSTLGRAGWEYWDPDHPQTSSLIRHTKKSNLRKPGAATTLQCSLRQAITHGKLLSPAPE